MKRSDSGNNILDAIENIRIENGVSKEIIFSAVEQAFLAGAQKRYGTQCDINAYIDRNTGNVRIYRILKVVDNIEDLATEIEIQNAKKIKKDANVGDIIEEDMPPVHFDRLIAQKMSDIITTTIKNAEKETEYDLYADRVGELVSGTVKKISPREMLIWIGKTEASLNMKHTLPNERFAIGDKVTACIQDVRRDNVNPQIVLSRSSQEFLRAVMANEIPEIYDDLVKIVSISREAGFRSKVAVMSSDSRLDPVGACIGPRGSRIKAVMELIKGERIDIIEYTNDIEIFIQRAISPAKPTSVNVNSKTNIAEIIVDQTNLVLAIGRKGQNVRLASKLTGYKIDIILDTEKQEKMMAKFNLATAEIAEQLNLDEIAAQVIVASGFYTIESIANANINEIAKIEGFDEETAEIVHSRAVEIVNSANQEYKSEIAELGIHSDLLELPVLTKEMILTLGRAEIKTITDFADLASDELVEILGEDKIDEEEAGNLVMIARRYVYGI